MEIYCTTELLRLICVMKTRISMIDYHMTEGKFEGEHTIRSLKLPWYRPQYP